MGNTRGPQLELKRGTAGLQNGGGWQETQAAAGGGLGLVPCTGRMRYGWEFPEKADPGVHR